MCRQHQYEPEPERPDDLEGAEQVSPWSAWEVTPQMIMPQAMRRLNQAGVQRRTEPQVAPSIDVVVNEAMADFEAAFALYDWGDEARAPADTIDNDASSVSDADTTMGGTPSGQDIEDAVAGAFIDNINAMIIMDFAEEDLVDAEERASDDYERYRNIEELVGHAFDATIGAVPQYYFEEEWAAAQNQNGVASVGSAPVEVAEEEAEKVIEWIVISDDEDDDDDDVEMEE